MSDITAIKAANDVAVTNKTVEDSITPAILGARLNAITDELRPYKVYTALMTQTGTDAPVATVLENTIGVIVWTYVNVGEYLGTLAASFPSAKVVCFISGLTLSAYSIQREDNDSVSITTRDFGGVVQDGQLLNTPIEIRVYP